MKNINTYILTAIVSLVMVVATAFLMTAADEPVRQAGYYLPMVFGAIGTWAASKAGLLELDYEERTAHRSAPAAAFACHPFLFIYVRPPPRIRASLA